MSYSENLPFLSIETGLEQYFKKVKAIPSLEMEEERLLSQRLIKDRDISAAHKLVTSHLKLVVKIALRYKGYGLSIGDLIAEGNLGLMQAVKKFNPELGFRLSTYATWWIKASIQEYILKTWSLVKIGTTAAQKKLFFKLRKLKNSLLSYEDRELRLDEYKEIAEKLEILPEEVQEMDLRLSKLDLSLNTRVADDAEMEIMDMIPDQRPNQETILGNIQDYNQKKAILEKALAQLNDRERDIIMQRWLQEEKVTLEMLKVKHNVSAERVRQIESKAFTKLQLIAQNLLIQAGTPQSSSN